MKRRTLLVGATGLIVANKVLAQPQVGESTKLPQAGARLSEVTVAEIYGLPEPEMDGSMVVVLKDRLKEEYLAIWIGKPEGASLYAHLHKVEMFRPSSQDFMAKLVKSLDGDIQSVTITLRDKVFYADTVVVGNGKSTTIDGRPSDAMALAVRFDAPLFVTSDLLKPGSLEQVGGQIREQSAKDAKRIREQANP